MLQSPAGELEYMPGNAGVTTRRRDYEKREKQENKKTRKTRKYDYEYECDYDYECECQTGSHPPSKPSSI